MSAWILVLITLQSEVLVFCQATYLCTECSCLLLGSACLPVDWIHHSYTADCYNLLQFVFPFYKTLYHHIVSWYSFSIYVYQKLDNPMCWSGILLNCYHYNLWKSYILSKQVTLRDDKQSLLQSIFIPYAVEVTSSLCSTMSHTIVQCDTQ